MNVYAFSDIITPLGYTSDGLFAYLKKTKNTELGCYWFFDVVNLVDDKSIASLYFVAPNCKELENTSFEDIPVTLKDQINELLDVYNINSKGFTFNQFPVTYQGRKIDLVLEDYSVSTEEVKKRIVATSGSKQKYIGFLNEITDDGVKTIHSFQVLGYLKSVDYERVAVLIQYTDSTSGTDINKISVFGLNLKF